MALAKLLSNPAGPLLTLLDQKRWGCKDAASLTPASMCAVPDIAAGHRRAGWVVEAVVRVLADRGEPMQAKEVHAAVEALLGEPVRWPSVRHALASNVRGRSPRFIRLARGRYELRHDP